MVGEHGSPNRNCIKKVDSPSSSFIDLDENKENTYDFEETVPDTPIVKTVMSKEGYDDGETPDLMLS